MSEPTTPAQMRDLIVERLTGATGDPALVVECGRACATRVLAALREKLHATFNGNVAMELESVEPARFADALPSPDGFDALTIVSAETSPDALMIATDADAIAIAVCAYFGGDPELRLTPITRALSTLEREVAALLSDMLALGFNGSGSRAFRIRQPIPRPISGPDIARLTVRDGPAAAIRFVVLFGPSRGSITVMIPQRLLLSLRGDATAAAQPAQPARWRARFSEEIIRSTVELEATVALRRMTLGELSGLQPGQIIEFPANAQANTRLAAGEKQLFTCEFGKLGANYTVRVLRPFDEEEDLVESILSE